MNPSNNTILVTGGGSGIGKALAVQLLEHNTVIVCGRSQSKLEALRQSHPSIHTLVCDLSEPKEVSALAITLQQQFPALNVLVNNAGVMRVFELSQNQDPASIQHELNTNLLAPMLLTQALLPVLLKQPEAAIVNVTSGAGLVPMPAAPVYSASKAALHSFSKSLRFQLRDTKVKVFEVLPPLVATDMPQNLGSEGRSRPMVSPESVAKEIVEGLGRDRLEMVLGANQALALAHRFVPGVAEREMQKLK